MPDANQGLKKQKLNTLIPDLTPTHHHVTIWTEPWKVQVPQQIEARRHYVGWSRQVVFLFTLFCATGSVDSSN